jgi:hypothetical protein
MWTVAEIVSVPPSTGVGAARTDIMTSLSA